VTLSTTARLISEAVARGRAVPSFNVISLEHAEAIAGGADLAGTGVLLQLSENAVKFHGGMRPLLAACRELASSARSPIGIHLDHFESATLIDEAIALGSGFGIGSLMVDASTVGELRSPYFAGIQWWEGGSKTDVPRSIRELDVAGSLGATPLVVLTADSSGDLKKAWSPLQKTLAGLSTDSIHALAVGSGHVIQDDKPAIVLGAIAEVVEAASAGTTLPPCATTFPQRGGRCF